MLVAIETDVVFISVIIVGEFSAFEVPEEVADCVDVSGCLEVEVVVECTTCAGVVLAGAFDVVVDVVITGGFTILGFMSSEKSCASSNMKLALPLLVTTTVCVSNSKMVGDWYSTSIYTLLDPGVAEKVCGLPPSMDTSIATFPVAPPGIVAYRATA